MYRTGLGSITISLCLSFSIPHGAESLPDQLAEWTRTEEKSYAGQALYDYINGGADLYFEYGFVRVDVGYYNKEKQEILVEVYTMSDPLAATGVYSYFRNYAAENLPEPYAGKLYDSYLEALNGAQYVKVVNYDSIGVSEKLRVLKDLLPKPTPFIKPDYSKRFPSSWIPDSEIIFNGPLALKNFCPLGRKNFFGVGKRTKAWGTLVRHDKKSYKWVTVMGDSAQLSQDEERFLVFQRKNDYAVHSESDFAFLEDQLSGNNMALISKGNSIFFLFGIETKEEANTIFHNIP